MPTRFTRALIVDDHPMFCDALSLTLRVLLGIAQVDTADRLDAALTRLEKGPLPDVILFDLHLPDVTGIDGLLRLRAQAPEVPVLVISSVTDERVMAAALRAGAQGFMPKHARREVLVAALTALAEGRQYLPEGFVVPDETPQDDALQRLSGLTRQQARILQHLCEGALNKQIAHDLAITEATVKAHVTAIMRKLGVHSRTQAVLMANAARFSTLMPDTAGEAGP
ncbi:response regulator transcription factor [Gemmobacter serpentinus]|uniref:response regulator transcription factor n=1 Tax=Gemmobacter serpentinus TaxID=2652247 RepID=UPI001CF70B5F|nr:response regulator transcription factor [Gemmobacter serpentinus]